MQTSTYEPPPLEVKLTLALGLTVLSPYYRSFANSLHLDDDERVLDFGSGSGMCSRHTAARLQRGGRLDCVDISSAWQVVIRRTLRRYANVDYYLGRITELGLPDAGYDLIVIHFVLHDIPAHERPAIIQVLGRKLKPGGRLVLREPQGEGLTPQELDQIAAAAGLLQTAFTAHKTAIGAVYDICYTQKRINHENLCPPTPCMDLPVDQLCLDMAVLAGRGSLP